MPGKPSAAGTTIGYLRVGQGLAVVILHGSNESARSHTQLALGLADDFTVYLPGPAGAGAAPGGGQPAGRRASPEQARRLA